MPRSTRWTRFRDRATQAGARKGSLAALAGLVLLGAVLRLHGLADESLWNDELSSWYQGSHRSIARVIQVSVRPDVHPPGYQILLHVVRPLLGEDEFALRLPSAIAGVLCILAIHLVGRVAWSSREGLLAAALMAASWTPVYYSQEARPYLLLMLFAILSFLAQLRLLADPPSGRPPRWTHVAAYAGAATAASYTHYYGLLLVLLQGTYLAAASFRRPAVRVRVTVAHAVILGAYLPWIPEVFRDLGRTSTWIPRPTWAELLDFVDFLYGSSAPLALVALGGTAVLAWQQARKIRPPLARSLQERLGDPTVALLFWLAAPFTLALVKSLVSTPVFTNRNLILCLPPAYLLLARALTTLPGSRRLVRGAPAATALLLALALTAQLVWRLDYYGTVKKEQFREAVRWAIDRGAGDPGALVFGCVWNTRHLEYYFERSGTTREVLGPISTAEDLPRLRSALDAARPETIWYIAAHRYPEAEILEYLSRAMHEVHHEAFHGAHVWQYRQRAPDASQ